MSDFPTLKTGAVLQYPAQKEIYFATQVLRFVDGSEQRFRQYSSPLRRWLIRLDLLDPSELQSLRAFFQAQAGEAENFTFTDPWDGVRYTNCSLADGEMMQHLLDEVSGATSLAVKENGS